MTTATRADRALERVQNLYFVQTRLIKLLESDLSDPIIRRETQTCIRELQALLNQADKKVLGYMGGEEVWLSIKLLPKDAQAALKASPVSVQRMKEIPMKKISKAKPAKAVKAKAKVKAGKKSRR